MNKLLKHDIANIPQQYVDLSSKKYGVTSFHLAKAGGEEKLHATLDIIEVGASSCKLHSHSTQEEFFLHCEGDVHAQNSRRRGAARRGRLVL